MKSPSSENSIISSIFSLIFSFVNPKRRPDKIIFSYPDNSTLKPSPIDNNATVLSFISTVPVSGENIPAIVFNNVLFPLPFLPITPITLPFSILKLIFFNAVKMSFFFHIFKLLIF